MTEYRIWCMERVVACDVIIKNKIKIVHTPTDNICTIYLDFRLIMNHWFNIHQGNITVTFYHIMLLISKITLGKNTLRTRTIKKL
jgi:hypothetical protein